MTEPRAAYLPQIPANASRLADEALERGAPLVLTGSLLLPTHVVAS